MGGYVALAFLRRHPSRVRALFLADTRAAADSAEARAGREKAIALVAAKGVSPYAEELVPKLVAPSNERALDLAMALATLQSPVGVAGALAALRDRPDATRDLADVDVPATVLVGALDAITPPAEAEKVAQAIRGAKLITVEGAGHLSALEAPDRVATAIEELMARARA
jgi:pimeloyl-ACP methyl ester carboxylesterase